jgi:hypothetical protein
MTEYNYLPTIKRARLSRAGFQRQAPVRGLLDFGGNGRTYLTDVAFYSTGTGNVTGTNPLVRIGKWGRGLLTEAFYPLSLFNTKVRQEFGVWEFAKPYRLFPGERLTALVEYTDLAREAAPTRDRTVPAVMFNAVRVVDNRPVLLYDNLDHRGVLGLPVQIPQPTSEGVRLSSEKLQCPADSPVDIYSCVGQPTTSVRSIYNPAVNPPALLDVVTTENFMIYGPDGRQWWDQKEWPCLFDPTGFVMDLNKPEWVLNPGESFFCEFITNATVTDMTVSLRGQVEVSR